MYDTCDSSVKIRNVLFIFLKKCGINSMFIITHFYQKGYIFIMRKSRLLSTGLVFVLGVSMLSGCGKKKSNDDYIAKYAAMCQLGEYKGVEYHPMNLEVTDADVQYQVMQLVANSAAEQVMETGEVVASGDVVDITFDGTVDGVAFDGGSTNGSTYELTLGSGRMIPGFEEGIIGHKVGETFTIDVTFPEDYGKENLNGKDAQFKICIVSAVHKVAPEYNDAFVASNTDCQTVEEYEASVRADLEEQNAKNINSYNESNVTTTVIENSVILEYPEKEMEDMLNKTMENVKTEANAYGYTIPDYISARYGVDSEETFKSYLQESIKDFMSEKIVICAVAKAESIKVSDDEIAEYKKGMMDAGGFPDEATFDGVYTADEVMYYTLADKVVDFLVENAVPVEDEATDTDAPVTEVTTEATTEATKTDAE